MTERTASPRVVPLFVERWSPRSFDESAMPQEDLETILEGATWAPSAYNHQPWRFVYAHRADPAFADLLSALVPFNQSWAKDASVLLFIISEEKMGEHDNHTHSFDAGAAWAQLALQAHALGYRAHGMSGVDWDRAREVLGVPEGYRVEAAAAIGRQAPAEKLPEGLREREVKSDRKPVSAVAASGKFAW